jgi:hypothetical protein
MPQAATEKALAQQRRQASGKNRCVAKRT